jgi:bifunctional non-homologous end joining protein LigD
MRKDGDGMRRAVKSAGRKRGSLDAYRRKRDFSRTPEPPGRKRAGGKTLRFVVQKHAARRLHFDFRLELQGVLKSWAVTKGPSFDPAVPRLAVRTEDHPLEYGGFEGVIPEGQYGAGTVMLWDRGSWVPDGDPARRLAKGKLDFRLRGKRMKGRWHLVRTRARPGEVRENWLLIKGADAFAKRGHGDSAIARARRSVRSDRSMAEIAAARLRRPAAKRAKRGAKS